MGIHSFISALGFGIAGQFDGGGLIDFHMSDDFHKHADPQSTRVAGGGPGRQNVVGAGNLVGINFGCVFADKKGAVMFQQGQDLTRVAGMDFQMLRSVLVGIACGIGETVDNHRDPFVLP